MSGKPKKKKGLLKALIKIGSSIPIKSVSEPFKVIKETTEAVDHAKGNNSDIINVLQFPLVMKACDVNQDGKIDMKDAEAFLKLRGKRLYLRIGLVVGAIAVTILLSKYGL